MFDDEVINFFCSTINAEDEVNIDKMFIVSSFFITKFMISSEEKQQNCVNTFFKNAPNGTLTVILPFFLSTGHWTLGVINIKTQELQYYDHAFGKYDPPNFNALELMSKVATLLLQNLQTRTTKNVSDWISKIDHEICEQIGTVNCGVFLCGDVLAIRNKTDFPKNEDVLRLRGEIYTKMLPTIPIIAKSFDSAKTERIGSLPNAGNTCHFTAAFLSVCSHITLESVQHSLALQTLKNINDGSTSLLLLFKSVLTDSTFEDTLTVKHNISTIMSDLYPEDSKRQRDVGETYNKINDMMTNSPGPVGENLLGIYLKHETTCLIHVESVKNTKPEKFPSFTIFIPENIESITLSEAIHQQLAGSFPVHWKCPKFGSNEDDSCKSETIQKVVGPAPILVTIYLERHTSGGLRLSTSKVVIPSNMKFELVVHHQLPGEDGSEPRYEEKVHRYEVLSAVYHTYDVDDDRSDGITQELYSIPSPQNGHYILCKVVTSSEGQTKSFYLYDDSNYPNIKEVTKDFMLEQSQNVVLITAVLITDEIKIYTESESSLSSDSEATVDEPSISLESKSQLIIRPLSTAYIVPTELLINTTDILFLQLRHYLLNNYKETSELQGYYDDRNTYLLREEQLNTSPTVFMDNCGPIALASWWKIELYIFHLVRLDCESSDFSYGLTLRQKFNYSRKVSETCQRSIVRTCVSHSNENECVADSNGMKCKHVFYELLCDFPGVVECFDKQLEKDKHSKVQYTDPDGIVTYYWLGQTVEDKFTNRSNFLAVMAHAELLYGLCPNQKNHLYQESDGDMDNIFIAKFPAEKTPSTLAQMTRRWRLIDSEASKLHRYSPNSTSIETNVRTQYRITQAVKSVMNVQRDSAIADLTAGRRGSLLIEWDLNCCVVGFEISPEVNAESIKLVMDLKNLDSSYKPQIHLVKKNYTSIKSFEGFSGACMYLGNEKHLLMPEYQTVIGLLFSTKSLLYFWDSKLTRNNFEKLVSTTEQRKWYVKIIKNCKQEANNHNVYLWFKKSKYWSATRQSQCQDTDDQVGDWISAAKNGDIGSPVTDNEANNANSYVSDPNDKVHSLQPGALDFSPNSRQTRRTAVNSTVKEPLSSTEANKQKIQLLEKRNSALEKEKLRNAKKFKEDLRSALLKEREKRENGILKEREKQEKVIRALQEEKNALQKSIISATSAQSNIEESKTFGQESPRHNSGTPAPRKRRSESRTRTLSREGNEVSDREDGNEADAIGRGHELSSSPQSNTMNCSDISRVLAKTLKEFGMNRNGEVRAPIQELSEKLSTQLVKDMNTALKVNFDELKENQILKKVDDCTNIVQKTVDVRLAQITSDLRVRDAEGNNKFYKAVLETVMHKKHSKPRSDSDSEFESRKRNRTPLSSKNSSNFRSTSPKLNRYHDVGHRHATRSPSRSIEYFYRSRGHQDDRRRTRSKSRDQLSRKRNRSCSAERKRRRQTPDRSQSDSRCRHYIRSRSPGTRSYKRLQSVGSIDSWTIDDVSTFLRNEKFPDNVLETFRREEVHGKVLQTVDRNYIAQLRGTGEGNFKANQIDPIFNSIQNLLFNNN